MAISLLGSIGAKCGADLIGSIMEKTLPSALEFIKSNVKASSDIFDKVVSSFGGRTSNTEPAKQYSLELPRRFQSMMDGQGSLNLGSLSDKLGKLKSVLDFASKGLEMMTRFQQHLLHRSPSRNQPETGSTNGSGSFGNGLNVDTNAMARSTGYGGTGASEGMGPMEMFQRMQEAQQAAQMFELAVKIADIQHQAAMSAIRGIKY